MVVGSRVGGGGAAVSVTEGLAGRGVSVSTLEGGAGDGVVCGGVLQAEKRSRERMLTRRNLSWRCIDLIHTDQNDHTARSGYLKTERAGGMFLGTGLETSHSASQAPIIEQPGDNCHRPLPYNEVRDQRSRLQGQWGQAVPAGGNAGLVPATTAIVRC